jgi:hypothetical protein
VKRIIFAAILISIVSAACSKKNTKTTRSNAVCNWTYQNTTHTANKCFMYIDSFNKVFYMADTNTVESVNFGVPFLALQSFDIANPADSAHVSMNHKQNDTTFIGMLGTIGSINITSLSLNLATVNFVAIIDGDTCTGSVTDVPY